MAGMSSLKELLSFEGHHFSITVTHCLSVKESLALCYEVNEHVTIQILSFYTVSQKNVLTLKRYSSKSQGAILMKFGRNIQNTLE